MDYDDYFEVDDDEPFMPEIYEDEDYDHLDEEMIIYNEHQLDRLLTEQEERE